MNNIVITGVIDNEPIRNETANGVVVNYRIRSGKARKKGGRLWMDIACWGHQAAAAQTAAREGRSVIVTGRLTARSYRNADGGKTVRYAINAHAVEYLNASLPEEEPSEHKETPPEP